MQGKRKGETMASDEKKILIVEDEKVIRDAVSAYLERENYVVKGVGDGQSRLQKNHSCLLGQGILRNQRFYPLNKASLPFDSVYQQARKKHDS